MDWDVAIGWLMIVTALLCVLFAISVVVGTYYAIPAADRLLLWILTGLSGAVNSCLVLVAFGRIVRR